MLGYLRRHGLLTEDDTATQDGDDEQLVLEALATAAVTGTSLAGPQSRSGRVPYLQEAGGQPTTPSLLCAAYAGFSLHARTTVEHDDKPGRQRLIKYILRPPLAAERLEGGRVRLHLKRAFSDGTWAVEMDELSLVARLAALVHPPGKTRCATAAYLLQPASGALALCPSRPSQSPQMDRPATTLLRQPHSTTVPRPLRPKAKAVAIGPGACSRPAPSDCRQRLAPTATASSSSAPSSTTPTPSTASSPTYGLPTEIPRPALARGPPYYRGKVHRVRARGGQQELLA